ncbi:MAG: hypothetical protein M1838_003400 [Thelocarpon superellum]|nr:MAG: hypothetical protein M1838_003400 [Thelocarpon superellum]
MRQVRCAKGTAGALYRVFILPSERAQSSFSLSVSSARPLPRPRPYSTSHLSRFRPCPPHLPCTSQTRYYATTPPPPPPPPPRRQPRDEEISAGTIQIVNADNALTAPRPLHEVLSSLDRTVHVLIQVAPPDVQVPHARCKVVDKHRMREEERARAKAGAKPPRKMQHVVKQLELNWAIDANDLAHRLNRLREFLEKGMRVEVVMAPKRRKRLKLLMALGSGNL